MIEHYVWSPVEMKDCFEEHGIDISQKEVEGVLDFFMRNGIGMFHTRKRELLFVRALKSKDKLMISEKSEIIGCLIGEKK